MTEITAPEPAPQALDLLTPEMTELLAGAPVFAKQGGGYVYVRPLLANKLQQL